MISALTTSLHEYHDDALDADADTPSSSPTRWRRRSHHGEPAAAAAGGFRSSCLPATEKNKQPPLMDSQVYIFWPEDFDFACAGESCYSHGRPTGSRRHKFSLAAAGASGTSTRTPRSLRRWSSPQSFGFSTSVSSPPPAKAAAVPPQQPPPHPRTVGVAESSGDQSKSGFDSVATTPKNNSKPTTLRLQVPSSSASSGRRSKTYYCTSNKWGNQPPAGYI
jgi:hypothetical protein